jgi:uracil-DNA glycosylase
MPDKTGIKGSQEVKATGSSSTTAVKRQASLVEMFGGDTKKSAEDKDERPVKKLKSSSEKNMFSTLSTSSTNTSQSAGETLKRLNSIPFSLSQFQASLSEENKELLRLECEVMGLSWLLDWLIGFSILH